MDVSETIVPKSDQLNADDLLTGPITVTVMGIKQGPQDQPVHLAIDGGRQPYKPCKSMRRVLAVAWGLNGELWVGRSMRLYCEPTVKWGGKEVGGIRISHLSHIVHDLKIMLTVAKGVRLEYLVKVLQREVQETVLSIEDVSLEIEAAQTPQEWEAACKKVANMPKAAQEILKPLVLAARDKIRAMATPAGDE